MKLKRLACFWSLSCLMLFGCSYKQFNQRADLFIGSSQSINSAIKQESALQRLTEKLQHFHNMTARFHQVIYDEQHHVLQESWGRVLIDQPNRLRWETQKPIVRDIVSDGKALWINEPELKQVIRRSLDRSLKTTPLFLLTRAPINFQNHFTISALSQHGELTSFQCVSKEKESPWSRIVLSFKGQKIIQIKLVNTLDQVTVIDFSDVVINTNIARGQFSFKIPQGFDVVDQREMRRPS